ncbi:MAG: glutaconyl-CoA decarboxylase subunit alpha, partial [Desulfobacter sp.]|nr:glutaconyl-CoA decarboxylase subunit alpha [Desulfobacter sp.]
MKSYFQNMAPFGKALKKGTIKRTQNNYEQVLEAEKQILAAVDEVKNAGLPEEKINQRGQMTVWQRLEYIVDPGSWTPLHTLFNPADNVEGTTNVIDGLGKIAGKWAVVIGFDNKVMAGAWLAGQSENILRATDLAKRLNIPLVWLVNCSGAKLTEQEKFYANRRGSGTPFFRHAELEQEGIPVLAAIYGTNPAGGGYQSISSTVLFAHEKCNMAVGGAGIVSGMAPQGGFTVDMAEDLVQKAKEHRAKPPGSAATHYDHTGFFRFVYKEEKEVLDGVRDYMKKLPAYDPEFFRVTEPKAPAFEAEDVMRLLPMASKTVYDFDDILARLVDGSEHMEYRPDYGPEIYTGLCKVDGFLVACIGNRQGYLGKGYPEYADYPGMGAKLYRQGLLKMSEFV